eukprot:TRINITY_DN124_c0_g1_i1.p1 TRINITY_DN124_c0_g1~~TRINITY_DN124_c0_g1_i1.p1  ORF type:complete len:558 (+),score=157.14 TRINITY_DN124_c0_g1_i1:123-1676(+)
MVHEGEEESTHTGPVELPELVAEVLGRQGFFTSDAEEAWAAIAETCGRLVDAEVDDAVATRRARQREEAARRVKAYDLRARVAVSVGADPRRRTLNFREALRQVAMYDPPADLRPLDTVVDVKATLAALENFIAEIAAAESECGVLTADIPVLGDAEAAAVVRVFDHMLATFLCERHKRAHGYTAEDHRAQPLREGGHVPLYYANVRSQSVHRRKVLSMAGLRNLVRRGPQIYRDLQAELFVGRPSAYGAGKGLDLMRDVTGNTVDLDTCVLRPSCPVQLRAINARNKHLRKAEHASARAFSASDEAKEIAVAAATHLLEQFCVDFKLDGDAAKARKVATEEIELPIPIASHNADRGVHPLWHYINCGVDSFHVNVPNLFDVNGALLKAPFRCAEVYLRVHYMSEDDDDLAARLDTFYEDAVADSCFNRKWKALEEYAGMLGRLGSITDVLQRTQKEHQEVFLNIVDGDDDAALAEEKAAMWRLVEGRLGREVATGQLRAITYDDVAAWVEDPAAVL